MGETQSQQAPGSSGGANSFQVAQPLPSTGVETVAAAQAIPDLLPTGPTLTQRPAPRRAPVAGEANGTPSQQRSYIYALGRVEPRFPRLSVEKEFAQATGRGQTAGPSDREAVQSVLSERQNRYLARQLCWVLTVEGLETYILTPRDPADYDLLIEAVRPTPRPIDVDVVVGVRGPIAPPDLCNGLTVPVVAFDQI